MTQACNANLQTASGGGTIWEVCKNLAWVDVALFRGQTVVEGTAPCLHADASSLHGGFATVSEQGCGSWASLLACANSWEMQSGCDDASRMASCRDDGGVGVDGSVRPCPDSVPSSNFESARPWTLRGCDDAIAVY